MAETPTNPNLLPSISIAGNAASGLFGIASTILNNSAQRKLALRMYNMQRKDALADWQRQVDYDSPAAQMARYKAAGLNPHLIYGQQQNSPVVRSTPMDVPNIQPLPVPDIGGAIGQYQQIKQQQAQTNLTEEVMELTKIKESLQSLLVAGQITKNAASEFTLSQNRRNADLINENLTASLEQLKLKNELAGQGVYFGQKTMDTRIAYESAKLANSRAAFANTVQRTITMKQMLPYQKREAEARIGNIMASTDGKRLQNAFDSLTLDQRVKAVNLTNQYLSANATNEEKETTLKNLQIIMKSVDMDWQTVDKVLGSIGKVLDFIPAKKGATIVKEIINPKTGKKETLRETRR